MTVKVFYLVYGLTSGGIEKYSVNLFKHIDSSRIKLDFIVKENSTDFFDDEFQAAGGVKIPIVPKVRKGIFGKFVYVRNLIRIIRSNYDAAYFNLSRPMDAFKYPLLCRIFGIKNIIVHSHNSAEEGNLWIQRLLNRLGRRFLNKICIERFACSDKAAEWMFGKSVQLSGAYQLVNNGLELDKYLYNPNTRSKIRDEYEIADATIVLGHVGRFVTQKNHVLLLKIFSKFVETHPNSQLWLIGVGPLQAEMQELAQKMNLDQNILFLNERKNVNEYLQAFDVFLLPSLFEGLPIVAIEAQAAGLPCVISDNISRQVDLTENVKFVGVDSPPAEWCLMIQKSLNNFSRKNEEKMITNAGYNIEQTARQVTTILERINQ